MKSQREFTLVEVVLVVVILSFIAWAGVLGNAGHLDVGSSGGATLDNEVPAYNITLVAELFSQPLSGLSTDELLILADYCMWESKRTYCPDAKVRWATRAAVYQNQTIIQQTRGG